MRPLASSAVLISFALLAPASALPQQPPTIDSTRIIMAPPGVQVRQPMVLALVKDSLNPADRRFIPARMAAESLGFDFLPVLIGMLQVVDSRYHAIYSLPSDVTSGYLIIIPGHRPDIVRGYVEPDSLRRRIARYRQLAGPLVVK